MWGALSDERTGLSFTIAAGPRQRSHFRVRVLVTVFYSLRFDTSVFVASYDSQGYGGGIRPRLHTGLTQSKSKSKSRLTVSQSVSLGVEPRLGLMTRYLLLFDSYGPVINLMLFPDTQ
jgi:hypothetical protein